MWLDDNYITSRSSPADRPRFAPRHEKIGHNWNLPQEAAKNSWDFKVIAAKSQVFPKLGWKRGWNDRDMFCVFCLAELNLLLKSHQPGPKAYLSLSEPPVNHYFSFEGSLWNLSCSSHSRHLQGCCVFLEHEEMLSVFSSFAVPTQKPLAFLKKSWNTSFNTLLRLTFNCMGMWSEGKHQDQGHGWSAAPG